VENWNDILTLICWYSLHTPTADCKEFVDEKRKLISFSLSNQPLRRRKVMRKFRMQYAVVLICSAMAFAWAADKTKQRTGNDQGQNKAVVKQAIDEVFNKGRFELVNQLYEPNCVFHQGNKTMSLNEAVNDVKEWHSAAPNMAMTINKMNAEKDRVTVHWTAQGTNTGKGHGVSASGKHVLVHGNSEFRLANGKIVEEWHNFDEQEIFKQVGQNPGKR